jgi:hypothetical protein
MKSIDAGIEPCRIIFGIASTRLCCNGKPWSASTATARTDAAGRIGERHERRVRSSTAARAGAAPGSSLQHLWRCGTRGQLGHRPREAVRSPH